MDPEVVFALRARAMVLLQMLAEHHLVATIALHIEIFRHPAPDDGSDPGFELVEPVHVDVLIAVTSEAKYTARPYTGQASIHNLLIHVVGSVTIGQLFGCLIMKVR